MEYTTKPPVWFMPTLCTLIFVAIIIAFGVQAHNANSGPCIKIAPGSVNIDGPLLVGIDSNSLVCVYNPRVKLWEEAKFTESPKAVN